MRIVLPASVLLLASLAAPAGAQRVSGDVHVGVDSFGSDGDAHTGVIYGLTLTYDALRSRVVGGVQLDLDASDNRACERGVIVASDRACVDARRDVALSGRIGRMFGNATLVYVTAGYASARFNTRYELAGIAASDHEALDGIRIGLGLSAGLGRRLYGKLEYRYTNYEQGVSRSQGLLGVGLRF